MTRLCRGIKKTAAHPVIASRPPRPTRQSLVGRAVASTRWPRFARHDGLRQAVARTRWLRFARHDGLRQAVARTRWPRFARHDGLRQAVASTRWPRFARHDGLRQVVARTRWLRFARHDAFVQGYKEDRRSPRHCESAAPGRRGNLLSEDPPALSRHPRESGGPGLRRATSSVTPGWIPACAGMTAGGSWGDENTQAGGTPVVPPPWDRQAPAWHSGKHAEERPARKDRRGQARAWRSQGGAWSGEWRKLKSWREHDGRIAFPRLSRELRAWPGGAAV